MFFFILCTQAGKEVCLMLPLSSPACFSAGDDLRKKTKKDQATPELVVRYDKQHCCFVFAAIYNETQFLIPIITLLLRILMSRFWCLGVYLS